MSNSKQHQIKEIVKCGKDPVYFMNKYLKIQHPIKGLIPFKTYPFQDDCVKEFNDHRFNIILKSRQLGLSTLVAAYSVWQAIFYKEKNILIIATKLAVAQNFIRKVKAAIKSLPSWLVLPEISANNKQQVEFTNGSQIKAVPTSEDAGRSEALSLLIVDEAAFVRNFDELWMGLYPTLSTGGRAIVLSTPNGMGGQYYKLYTGADKKKNDFNPIKLMWDVHPERDQTWFDKETQNMSARQIAQELLCDFATSGETFFTSEFMMELQMQHKAPIETSGPDNAVWYWEYPKEGVSYLVSADVARGDGRDYSTFHVFNCKDFTIDCEFKSKIPPDHFASLLYDIARRYNKAVICPEQNAYGYTVLMKIRDMEYQNIYFESNKEKNKFLFGDKNNIGKAGYITRADTRPKMLSNFEDLVRNKKLKIRSTRLYDELKTFVYKNNKPQAMKGKNDDLVMSAAIGAWVSSTMTTGYSRSEVEMSAALLKGMNRNSSKINETIISPFYNKNINTYFNPFMPVTMTDGIKNQLSGSSLIGRRTEFDWLF
tara:strand:- start:1019 stop:2638 length:1620 start_codon:yes stop_codon:yes gene_type:complete